MKNIMFKTALILTICFAFMICSEFVALGQNFQTVYDGRLDPSPKSPSNADVQLIRRIALPKARQAWRSDELCTDEFEAIDVTSGSFTKPNSRQRAVLYRFCIKGHNIANNGIVVFENQNIVFHVVYNAGEDYSLQSLPDIDGNGLSELVIGDGSVNQGYALSVAVPIEISISGVKTYGIADVFDDDCGANPDRCRTLGYRILVKPGATPIFYRETYRKRNDRWIKSGAASRYSPRKGISNFRILK